MSITTIEECLGRPIDKSDVLMIDLGNPDHVELLGFAFMFYPVIEVDAPVLAIVKNPKNKDDCTLIARKGFCQEAWVNYCYSHKCSTSPVENFFPEEKSPETPSINFPSGKASS